MSSWEIDFVPFADGLDHPEGVAWGPDGHVYAGGEAGQLYRVSLDGDVRLFADTGGFVLGLCLDADANVYACDTVHRAVMRVAADGGVQRYASGTPERDMVNPNWPVFAADGTLFVSDSGAWGADDGCLWAVEPGRDAAVLRDDVRAFPNGMALSSDGAWLYCIETRAQRVVRVPIAGARSDGPLEEVVRLPERSVPDGLAFDSDGGLLMACYTPDVIYRLDPGGDLAVVAEDWERLTLAAPTNVAFCGEDRRTLVAASLGRWHLARATAPVAGAPLHHPTVVATGVGA
jgi:gluconolactonase